MKKSITLLLPLLLLAAACGEKTDGKKYVFPEAPFTGEAVRYTNTNLGGVIRSVSFTEGGTYLLVQQPDAKSGEVYSAGTYSVPEQGTYTLNGYGSVRRETTKGEDTEQVTFTPTDGEPVTLPCTVTLPESQDQLFRQWRVASTRIIIYGNTTVGADFNGCDLQQISQFLKDNGIIDKYDFQDGQVVSVVDISALGEINILYENGNVDHAALTRFAIYSLDYVWSGEQGAFGIQDGTASVSYEDDICIFEMNGKVIHNGKTTEVSVTWTLKEKKLL